ncbi:hypothetical protein M419DRAFT_128687 [Trichoderma reesei RUT C-30]|uniref:Uncharacterized protein n=1 Tax=Hypocrea jecorina (strain ATCC 56765 / BCRC 32924 / NRRL 11460 / Rut C-30) TaxID=1344414 RepID=A0A024SEC0_HYPJR|nr:hypothetical protein M419DRAFT_128687 [Trichoderma reesei RUT C-30]
MELLLLLRRRRREHTVRERKHGSEPLRAAQKATIVHIFVTKRLEPWQREDLAWHGASKGEASLQVKRGLSV